MGEKLQFKTIGAVAAELGVDRWRLAYLIERGKAPDASVKVPGRRLFTPGDVAAIKAALAMIQDKQGPPDDVASPETAAGDRGGLPSDG